MENKETTQIVKEIYDAISSKKAEDIRIIDIRNVTVIADYFIIATVNNAPQLSAMMDMVDEVMYKNGITSKQIEGNQNSSWVLMDYEDIIIHLFSKEDRLFYNLERIWQDGTDVDPESLIGE